MFYIVSYLVAFTIATRIGLSLGLQGLQIRYVDQINYSSDDDDDARYLVYLGMSMPNLRIYRGADCCELRSCPMSKLQYNHDL